MIFYSFFFVIVTIETLYTVYTYTQHVPYTLESRMKRNSLNIHGQSSPVTIGFLVHFKVN